MGQQAYDAPVAVIVVEDDRTFLSFWKRFLEKIGVRDYRLISNPYEAKELIQQQGAQLLISDITLKGINGYELAKLARERSPKCRVILTTAYSANLSRFDLASLAFHLLPKPYTNLAELEKLIRHLIAGDEHFDDISEDSFSENEEYPQVTEWKL